MKKIDLKAKDEDLKAKDEDLKAKDEDLKVKDEGLKAKDEGLKAKEEDLKAKDEGLKAKVEGLKAKVIELWKNKKPLAIAIILVIVFLLIGAGVAIAMNVSGSGSDGGVEDSMIDTDGDGVPDALDSDGDGIPDSEDTDQNSGDGQEGTDSQNNSGDNSKIDSDEDCMIDTDGDGVPDAKDTDGDGIPDSDDSDDSNDSQIDFEIPDLAEGSYEQWLAAGMVTGISMYYFEHEFDIKSIYIASETDLNSPENSKGAYVVFTVDGEEKVLQSLPLEGERSDKGTVDLYARNFGYATFDEVKVTDGELKKCTEIKFEDLEIYISQLLLPTIYER